MVRKNQEAPVFQDWENHVRWSTVYLSSDEDNIHTRDQNGWKYVYEPP